MTVSGLLWYPSRVTSAPPDRVPTGYAAPPGQAPDSARARAQQAEQVWAQEAASAQRSGQEAAPFPAAAIVPVKALDLAKSRLDLPAGARRQLALAFAADTLAALAACPEVAGIVVVTADPEVAALAAGRGARVVHDDTDSLDDAVALGVTTLASGRCQPCATTHDRPSASQRRGEAGILVAPSDLPALRSADVSKVLRRAAGHASAFVPDRAGTGTTMVVTAPGRRVVTAFGQGSAARHTGLGLYAVHSAPVRARHDVDTLADLSAAAALGVGEATAALLRAGVFDVRG